jgi:hypothetical protein
MKRIITVLLLMAIGGYVHAQATSEKKADTVTLPSKPKYVSVDTVVLKKLEGDYEVKPGMVATILVKEGKLMIDTHNDPLTELLPLSETLFDFSNMDARLEFFRDSAGKVEKFVFRQDNLILEAKKIK